MNTISWTCLVFAEGLHESVDICIGMYVHFKACTKQVMRFNPFLLEVSSLEAKLIMWASHSHFPERKCSGYLATSSSATTSGLVIEIPRHSSKDSASERERPPKMRHCLGILDGWTWVERTWGLRGANEMLDGGRCQTVKNGFERMIFRNCVNDRCLMFDELINSDRLYLVDHVGW